MPAPSGPTTPTICALVELEVDARERAPAAEALAQAAEPDERRRSPASPSRPRAGRPVVDQVDVALGAGLEALDVLEDAHLGAVDLAEAVAARLDLLGREVGLSRRRSSPRPGRGGPARCRARSRPAGRRGSGRRRRPARRSARTCRCGSSTETIGGARLRQLARPDELRLHDGRHVGRADRRTWRASPRARRARRRAQLALLRAATSSCWRATAMLRSSRLARAPSISRGAVARARAWSRAARASSSSCAVLAPVRARSCSRAKVRSRALRAGRRLRAARPPRALTSRCQVRVGERRSAPPAARICGVERRRARRAWPRCSRRCRDRRGARRPRSAGTASPSPNGTSSTRPVDLAADHALLALDEAGVVRRAVLAPQPPDRARDRRRERRRRSECACVMRQLPRGVRQRFERQAHQLLQLGAARVRLVERGGERRALLREQAPVRRARPRWWRGRRRTAAGGCAGSPRPDRRRRAPCRARRGARRRRRCVSRTALSSSRSSRSMREAIAVGLRCAPRRCCASRRASVPRSHEKPTKPEPIPCGWRIFALGPVDGAAALEARQAAARERGRGVVEALLLLDQREQDRVVREGIAQRVVDRRAATGRSAHVDDLRRRVDRAPIASFRSQRARSMSRSRCRCLLLAVLQRHLHHQQLVLREPPGIEALLRVGELRPIELDVLLDDVAQLAAPRAGRSRRG